MGAALGAPRLGVDGCSGGRLHVNDVTVLRPDLRLQILGVHTLIGIVLFLRRFTPTTAKSATTAAAAACDDTEADDQALEPALGHEEVVLHALLPKLLGHVESHGAVLVVNLALVLIAQGGVGVIDFLELLRGLWIVRILVWMIP